MVGALLTGSILSGGCGAGLEGLASPTASPSPSGTLYHVADRASGRIVAFDEAQTNWSSYGTLGSAPDAGEYCNAGGSTLAVATDTAGRLYTLSVCSPTHYFLIRTDDMSGTNWTVFDCTNHGITGPTSVDVDASGTIYLTDVTNRKLWAMSDMTGGGLTSLAFSAPYGPTTVRCAGGYVYYADLNNQVMRINGISGAGSVSVGSTGSGPLGLNSPQGLDLDSSGHIYVVDAGNRRVVRYDNMTGANPVSFSIGTSAGLTPYAPSDVRIGSNGHIAVTTTTQPRVYFFTDMHGTPATPVGSPGTGRFQFNTGGLAF